MRTFKQFILEMSFDSKLIRKKVEDSESEINSLLINLYIFKKSLFINQWEKELYIYIHNIDVHIKPKRKRLSFDTYFKCLYRNPFEDSEIRHTERLVDIAIGIEDKETPTVTINDILYTKLHSKIKKFHLEISKLLSKDEFTFKKWQKLNSFDITDTTIKYLHIDGVELIK